MSPEYQKLTTEQFRDLLLLEIFGVERRDQVKELKLTDEDWNKVRAIQAERFGNWDWNYGQSPAFAIQMSQKFPFGFVDFRFNVEQGVIKEVKVYGDFFGLGDISDVEDALVGVRFEREAVNQVFENLDFNKYFGRVTAEEILTLIFG